MDYTGLEEIVKVIQDVQLPIKLTADQWHNPSYETDYLWSKILFIVFSGCETQRNSILSVQSVTK